MWREINKIIQKSDHFVLTTHLNPDGDGIGAACALTELLIQMGKKVRFICDSPIPRKFAFLDYHGTHQVYHRDIDLSDVEVFFILDTHKRERIGALAHLMDVEGVTTICIDHHEVDDCFTPYHMMDPKACSVGAMVHSLYKASGYSLNLRAATGIYASIVCDTGRFCYSSTSPQAYQIAEECMILGVDPEHMYSQLFQHVTIVEAQLFASALAGMEIYPESQLAIQTICAHDCEKVGIKSEDLEHLDLEYIHDFNNLIENIRCFVLLREIAPNHVRVSLRSKKGLDMSPVVHALGGGGHSNAAGLTWQGTLEEIKKRLLSLLEELCAMQKL